MTYKEFLNNLMAGKIARVYFFYGDENYLIDEGVEKILTKFVKANTADFNRDVFYGDDADAGQIVNTALSVPMMADRRVIVVKNFNKLPQSGKELIVKYCKRPAPHTILVLTANSVDFRKKVYSELKSLTQAVECKALYDDQAITYIRQYAASKGKTINHRAAQLLQARLGSSLLDIVNEMDKLVQYSRDRREITEQDVDELVGISRSYNIFQLWDALGEKKLQHSLLIVRQMLEMGESAVFIVSSLTTYFTRLWKIRAMKRRGLPKQEIGKALRIHRYFLDRSIQQAGRYSDADLRRIFQLLLDADVKLKTSYQKPRIVLELLIYEMIRGNKKIAA